MAEAGFSTTVAMGTNIEIDEVISDTVRHARHKRRAAVGSGLTMGSPSKMLQLPEDVGTVWPEPDKPPGQIHTPKIYIVSTNNKLVSDNDTSCI
jgi:hypothetical protein